MANLAHKVLVVGLPQTGKTTFLAALWDVVGTGEVDGSLVLERLDGEKQHLNDLRDRWADCHEIPRTRVANEKTVSMLLKETASGVTSEVLLSDMSGESFERQWTERVWTAAYARLVQNASSVLLFIHPEKVCEAALILEAKPLIDRLNKDGPKIASGPKEEGAGEQAIPCEPRYAATQVQLVELLQFIRRQKPATDGLRIGVVISAWDIVQKLEKRKTPETWLSERLPLLGQYLRAGSDAVPFRVFGVSAQGGNLNEDLEKLRKNHKASDRIVVASGSKRSHDITAPVRWAMGVACE